jgi:anti-sigma B factor antagonist
MSFQATRREADGVTIFDLNGRVTLGDGSQTLRELIQKELDSGHKKIILNLAGVAYMDSTGLGELVSGYRHVKGLGGELKLLSLNKKVSDVLQITRLYSIFEIHNEESRAVASFQR